MYAVVWVGVLKTRYLQKFLPGGIPQWTANKNKAYKFASYETAEISSRSAANGMKRMGITVTIEVATL